MVRYGETAFQHSNAIKVFSVTHPATPDASTYLIFLLVCLSNDNWWSNFPLLINSPEKPTAVIFFSDYLLRGIYFYNFLPLIISPEISTFLIMCNLREAPGFSRTSTCLSCSGSLNAGLFLSMQDNS